jgi:hypothetical protein
VVFIKSSGAVDIPVFSSRCFTLSQSLYFLLGNQSWWPLDYHLQLSLLALLQSFLRRPSRDSGRVQLWVASYPPMLRTSSLDSTSTSGSRSTRLSMDLRQPMVCIVLTS